MVGGTALKAKIGAGGSGGGGEFWGCSAGSAPPPPPRPPQWGKGLKPPQGKAAEKLLQKGCRVGGSQSQIPGTESNQKVLEGAGGDSWGAPAPRGGAGQAGGARNKRGGGWVGGEWDPGGTRRWHREQRLQSQQMPNTGGPGLCPPPTRSSTSCGDIEGTFGNTDGSAVPVPVPSPGVTPARHRYRMIRFRLDFSRVGFGFWGWLVLVVSFLSSFHFIEESWPKRPRENPAMRRPCPPGEPSHDAVGEVLEAVVELGGDGAHAAVHHLLDQQLQLLLRHVHVETLLQVADGGRAVETGEL